jgi:hypothetical protein
MKIGTSLLIIVMTLLALFHAGNSVASTDSQALVDEGRILFFDSSSSVPAPSYSGILAANEKFEDAIVVDPADEEAQLFYAVTRILAFALTQGETAEIDTLREILEAFGLSRNAEDTIAEFPYNEPPELYNIYVPPATTPTGEEFRSFLAEDFVNLLEGSIANLNAITTQSFTTTLSAAETGDLPIEIDMGDVLFFKSLLQTAKASIQIFTAYDMDINIRDFIVQINADALQFQRDLIERYNTFLALRSDGADQLLVAKNSLMTSIDTTREAFAFIKNESDIQDDDLVSFDSAEEIATAQFALNALSEAQLSLGENRQITKIEETWTLSDHDGRQLLLKIAKNITGTFLEGTFHALVYDNVFLSNEGWVDSFVVSGSAITMQLSSGDLCTRSFALTGTLSGDQIVDGTFTEIQGTTCPEQLSGTFIGFRNDLREEALVDLNHLFGNTDKVPLDIREVLPSFDQDGDAVGGTFPQPFFNNLFPEITSELALVDILGWPVVYDIPSSVITLDGNNADWSGVMSVGFDDQDVSEGSSAATDIQSLSVAMDAENFYWMMALYDSPASSSIQYAIHMDGEWNNIISEVEQDQYALYSSDDNGVMQLVSSNPDDMATGTVIEARIPLGEFDGITKIEAGGRTASNDWSWDYIDNILLGFPQNSAEISGAVSCSAFNGSGKIFIWTFDGPDPLLSHKLGDAVLGGPGAYTITGLPIGKSVYFFVLWDADDNGIRSIGDYYSWSLGPVEVLEGGTTYDINIVNEIVAGSISGTISGDDTGLPLAGVLVVAYSEEGWWGGESYTDSNGNYTIAGLLPGTYRVWVSGNSSYAGEYYDEICAVVGGIDTGGIDVSLTLVGSISGTVAAQDTGLPLSGVWVYAYSELGEWGESYTDNSGNYTIAGLMPGTYLVWGSGNSSYVGEYYNDTYDWASASPVTVIGGAETGGIDFILALSGSISGAITADDTGLPLAGVWVYAYSELGGWRYSYTDSSGNYMITGLVSGAYRVGVLSNSSYVSEYYNDTYDWDSASLVTVAGGVDTGGIDMSLAVLDTDNDGIGNNVDLDDDNDTLPDDWEIANLLDPLYAGDASWDADGDGYSNLEEYTAGTDPQDSASKPSIGAVPNDFNGDGRSDILLRSQSTGTLWSLLLDGNTVNSSAKITGLSSDWKVAATADFNGDGTVDILLRNQVTGQLWLYSMNGNVIASSSSVTALSLAWQIISIADFNRDAKADILLYDSSTGQTWMYLMDGVIITESGEGPLLTADLELVATEDCNGDGTADVLLRNTTTGTFLLVELDNTTILSSSAVFTANLTWEVEDVADFNGDGKSDILVRNSGTGQLWMYQLDGSTVLFSGNVGALSLSWAVEDVSDFTGDNMADILLYNQSTRSLWLYEMNGSTIVRSGAVVTLPSGWEIESIEDYNGDGNADILLRNSSTGQFWLYELNGNTVSSSGSVTTMILDWQTISPAGESAPEETGSNPASDFNGDGKADILLRSQSTGLLWEYQMSSNTILVSSKLTGLINDWAVVGVGDFDGDGKGDVLVRNLVTGQLWLYQLNGTTIQASNSVGALSLDWEVAGVADFNGDSKADILLRSQSTGLIWQYQMNGNAISASAKVTGLSLDWSIVGAGDLGGDGKGDVLVRNTVTGQLWLYQLNGVTIQTSSNVGTLSLDWKVAGLSDYNGDGKSDILLRSQSTGLIWQYQMNGNIISASAKVGGLTLDWAIADTTDYSGDGMGDILIRDTVTGQLWMYLLNGTTIQASNAVGSLALDWGVQ